MVDQCKVLKKIKMAQVLSHDFGLLLDYDMTVGLAISIAPGQYKCILFTVLGECKS